MKKNLLTVLLLTFLTFTSGCSKIFSKTPEPFKPEFEGTTFQGENFSIYVAKDWQTITTFAPEIPKETVVAFRAPDKIDNVRTNVTVIKSTLSEEINNNDLLKQKKENYQKSLLDFKEIDQKEIQLIKNDESVDSLLIYFSGKESKDSPVFRFMQTAVVDEKTAYVITATLPDKATADVVKITSGVLKSFVLKTRNDQ